MNHFLLLLILVLVKASPIDYIDLTTDDLEFTGPSKEIKVQSKSYITKTFIENYPDYRVFNTGDNKFYITGSKGSIKVAEYDFSTAVYSQAAKLEKPISMKLVHGKTKGSEGSGSISTDTSISFSVRTKPSYRLSLDPTIGPIGIKYSISKERYITLSNTIDISVSCDSKNGHSVQLFLVVGTTKVDNIKTQTFTWNGDKFIASKPTYTSTYVNPKGQLECRVDTLDILS